MNCLFLFAAGCDLAQPKPTVPPPAAVEQAAPLRHDPDAAAKSGAAPAGVSLAIKDYDGIVGLIEGHQGKVVVVDCWSTWCEPCMKEFPGLVALHEKYGPEKVACISLSLDYDGTPGQKPEDSQEQVLEFLRSQRAVFDNVLSAMPADELSKQLDIPAPPTVFVYDRQGKLARRFDGPEAKYEQHIAPLVAKLVDNP